MAYNDYGALVFCNGIRRKDKEDAATFATNDETFGTEENVPSGLKIFASILNSQNKEHCLNGDDIGWVESIHHGILGDGDIRVILHKQGKPSIYERNGDYVRRIEYVENVDYYNYGEIKFEYKGYLFLFRSGHPYLASMVEPDGTRWGGTYDCGYGAGFEDE